MDPHTRAIGQFREGKLFFVKKVRDGFVPRLREQVYNAIHGLEIPRGPFVNLPEASDRRGAVDKTEMRRMKWVKPNVKCEVEFAEWTGGGRLRHASLRRLV